MVVVEGVGLNVLHNIERGELSGRGICPGEYVHGEMSMQQTFSLVRGYVAGSQAHKAFLRPCLPYGGRKVRCCQVKNCILLISCLIVLRRVGHQCNWLWLSLHGQSLLQGPAWQNSLSGGPNRSHSPCFNKPTVRRISYCMYPYCGQSCAWLSNLSVNTFARKRCPIKVKLGVFIGTVLYGRNVNFFLYPLTRIIFNKSRHFWPIHQICVSHINFVNESIYGKYVRIICAFTHAEYVARKFSRLDQKCKRR